MALRRIKADLHIHTSLSPCASLDMSPLGIVKEAVKKGLEVIGVCDHNSAENVLAVKKAGRAHGITVIGGMEVTSSEEVHFLVFFDSDEDLFRFQDIVYKHLRGTNDEAVFGQQVVVDEEDGVVGFCDRLLIGATSLTAEKIVEAARSALGENMVIAAHIDREMFSIISQLGFIPPSLSLDAVEVSSFMNPADAIMRFSDVMRYPIITGSDAHALEDIGSRSMCYTIEEGSVAEIKLALTGKHGRKVVY